MPSPTHFLLPFAPPLAELDNSVVIAIFATIAGLMGMALVKLLDYLRKRDADKPKMVTRISVDMLRAWVIPPVVEEHARRYAGAHQVSS